MKKEERLREVSVEEFKKLLKDKKIRPASLNDVYGTHHTRCLYIHPNTKEYFVSMPQQPTKQRRM